MRCLADILDIVDDCNVIVPCWRVHVHNPPLHAKRSVRQFIGHVVACAPRNQVGLCGDCFHARSRQHGLQGLPAVIRKVNELDVEPRRNPGGISRGQSEVVYSRDTVLVRFGLFGPPRKLALLNQAFFAR